MPGYERDNIFGKIVRGEIPSHKVYEDGDALAIMDAFPQSPGHVLVIPKAESRNLLDADPAVLSKVFPLVQRLAIATHKATGADGIRLAQFNEAPAGQTVFHLHFHIIPAYSDVALYGHQAVKGDDTELADFATRISKALSA